MSAANHAGNRFPPPPEAVMQFLMDHEEAVEQGRAPPDPPEPLLNQLNPGDRAHFLHLIAEQRRRQAREPQKVAACAAPPPEAASDGGLLPAVPGYEILGELGRGGMSVVYKARQTHLSRVVALKMILSAELAGRDDLDRFRREAEMLAGLQHPHIVQIYEVGEHNRRPFLALEFVDGGSLADQLHGVPLASRQAAQLLEILARAVHAAHQRDVVHRDLKPANVLMALSDSPGAVSLGSDPQESLRYEPKITDFGLAKRLDVEKGNTPPGAVLGTPGYMAPEQARAQSHAIAPATDVYALGAILYEMLTGRPPFQGTTLLDTLEQVRTEEPVPVRRLQPKVPRELETICLKAMAKERSRRYQTAQELAEDLRRWLHGEPIRARPMGVLGKLGKWCRRKPALAGLMVALVLAVAGGFAGVTWQWRQAEVHRANERRQHEQTERAYQLADDAMGKLTDVMEQVQRGSDVVGKLTDALERLPTPTDEDAERVIAVQQAVVTLLEKFVAEFPHQADRRDQLARHANLLGSRLHGGRRIPEAEVAYRKAMTIWARLVEEFSDNNTYRRRLGAAQSNLGVVLNETGRPQEAEEVLRQSLAIRRHLAAEFPDDPDYQSDLGLTLNNLGSLLRDHLGQPDRARQHWEEAVRYHWKAVQERPQNRTYREYLGHSSRNLVRVLLQLGEHAEAAKAAREGLKIFPGSAVEYRRLGGWLAHCVPVAEKDQRLPEERRKF